MKEQARLARAENRIVGLIPTMGALHEGHLALVKRAKRECSQVITSIFVNPKQFGPKEDLAKYPRTFDADAEKLAAAGVDAIFAPEPADVYPPGFRTYVNVVYLSMTVLFLITAAVVDRALRPLNSLAGAMTILV